MVNNVPGLSYVLWRFCSFNVVALGLLGRFPRYFFAYSTVHSTIPLWDLALSSSAVFLSNARHIIQTGMAEICNEGPSAQSER